MASNDTFGAGAGYGYVTPLSVPVEALRYHEPWGKVPAPTAASSSEVVELPGLGPAEVDVEGDGAAVEELPVLGQVEVNVDGDGAGVVEDGRDGKDVGGVAGEGELPGGPGAF